jgi:RNA polymerase sigma-70 factor (ECF subfamily)
VEASSSATSLGLLARARSREPAAWDRLVRLYTPLVEQWARLAGLQDTDVEDVRQEVFLAVSGSLETFRRENPGDTFRGWLRTITRFKVADLLRRKPPRGEGGSEAAQRFLQVPQPGAPDGARETEDLTVLYRRALELIAIDFEETSWKAFLEVVINDRKPAEVAAELGITTNAVYLARGRVLNRLREEFVDLIDQ